MTNSSGASSHALEGVRVLDLSRVLAGPWCSQILGDLGAKVIKVEAPGAGDDTRAWGPPFLPKANPQTGNPNGESAYYLSANRNKRSVAIDLAKAEGAALVRRLAANSHIVLENFKSDGLKKYGLDHATLSSVNPRLIYCSITGFGQSGPYAERGGYDFVAQAMGGLMSLTGQPDGEAGAGPLRAGVAICDLFTGVYAATAVLAALRHAERTGQGQRIDCALLDTQVAMLANQGLAWLVGGVVGGRTGNCHPTVVPYRTFRTRDSEIVVAVGNDRQYRALCKTLNRPDLAEDERFLTNALRVRNREVLEAELGGAIVRSSAADLSERLTKAGVPVGPINRVDQVFADPQVIHRDLVHRFVRDDGVEIPSVAYPPRLSRTPARFDRPPPRLGEHTREVLAGELGLDGAQIEGLMTSGVVAGL